MRSQPDLDGNRQLDRLTVHHARAGQSAPTGPIYLARDISRHGLEPIWCSRSAWCAQPS